MGNTFTKLQGLSTYHIQYVYNLLLPENSEASKRQSVKTAVESKDPYYYVDQE